MLRETSIAPAPWYVVEGADPHYRMLTVGKILLAAMQQTERRAASPSHHPPWRPRPP